MTGRGKDNVGIRLFGKRPGLFVSNSRFYLLSFAAVLSLIIFFGMRLIVASDTLFLIRVQQVFGFVSLTYWYLALLATPLSVVLGKQGFMQQYLYARRALGVSAAYFAVLHMLIGVFGQLGGVSNLFSLPGRFQQALLLGFVGVVTLSLMALTSFDKVIKWMTFPRWKWLHRLGYIASALVLLHIWLIGTHLESEAVRLAIYLPIVLLFALEAWRISGLIEKSTKEPIPGLKIMIFISFFVVAAGSVALIPNAVNRYHDDHRSSGVGH